MNREEALKKLKKKSKYIDPDVFKTLEDKIIRDIKEEIEEENDKFVEKAILILNSGISIGVLKNLILSEIYSSKIIKEGV